MRKLNSVAIDLIWNKFMNKILNITGNNNIVTINDRTYSGTNISIIDGVITMDGQSITKLDTFKVDVVIHGDCNVVQTTQGNITANGNINCAVTTSQGDITVNNHVTGDVSTSMGNIDINGNVTGNVKTSIGNIRYKK